VTILAVLFTGLHRQTDMELNRRNLIATLSSGAIIGTAGCNSLNPTDSNSENGDGEGSGDGENTQMPLEPIVYRTFDIHEMVMGGMKTVGPYKLSVSFTTPHWFWTVTGSRTNRVEHDGTGIHFMLTLWDEETGARVPTGDITTTLSQDGEEVASSVLWPMISQEMGFHFGDNIALPNNGDYTVDIEISPATVNTLGAFEDGRFDENVSTTLEITTQDGYQGEPVPNAGVPGALEVMTMNGVPTGQLPTAENLPGQILGGGSKSDADFIVSESENLPAGVDGEGRYLAVSPRTPYNRIPLPLYALSAQYSTESESDVEMELSEAIHPDYGHHYGAVIDTTDPVTDVSVLSESPPQVSRHRGYEKAFIEGLTDTTIDITEDGVPSYDE
jgi:hypothetical protein